MKSVMRGTAALLLAAALAPAAMAQEATTPSEATAMLSTERARASYMVGMDVGASLRNLGPGLDLAAFERSLRNALAGGEPLLDEATARRTMTALAARGQAQHGGQPPGTPLPDIDWTNASLVAGLSVGGSLSPVADELDVDTVMQAIRTVVSGAAPALDQAAYAAVQAAFSERMQAKLEARAKALGDRNRAEGAAFLAENKARTGVFTTGSGLQYMVLRAGSGPRPAPSDTVRVHYAGSLLDGTEFDSSYGRGEPTEFRLDQVIPGWTEGLALMPVGAKYRFWIPSGLAYGKAGTPGGPIGPDATLVFDVELLAIP